jgi:metacaspase-1
MAQGRALHIGLNQIDARHYGTSGELFGCHADAQDMRDLSKKLGYNAKLLLDPKATADNVQQELRHAAAALESGDTFLLTYSGHGGQVPDTNGDETDARDETWCLYDRMLVDDELYALYAAFAAGVRIAVLSDSCHSGTVTRELDLGGRCLPVKTLERVYAEHKALYDGIQGDHPSRDEKSLDACIILISGCQDNQTSADGDGNGLFTEHLKAVWHDGSFKGTLHRLRNQIVATMPPEQTPNYNVVGKHDRAFERAQAFAL